MPSRHNTTAGGGDWSGRCKGEKGEARVRREMGKKEIVKGWREGGGREEGGGRKERMQRVKEGRRSKARQRIRKEKKKMMERE